ncbi:beta-1,6-N-acetylglucosaminyltransferase [uncultured Parolsenella sp.]|uniref:beta-1,6-N-acetylglucosaminyltransferase n=1 Tax=uncultured Parolsenella sp. TaxID=2083008 RepID=UPI0027D9781C|nr:beta-1,6-N-acetylglucosaminyltransferase [uncultured Parolsenella sp.]
MSKGRHAYLILAHGHWHELQNLISALDYPRNDIYLHLDKKWKDVDTRQLMAAAKQAHIVLTDRLRLAWGGYSIIQAEMLLFEAAVNDGPHDYYHLMSGLDLPVKSQAYIYKFFEDHAGENFFTPVDYEGTSRYRMRFEQYHFLQDSLIGRKRNLWKYLEFAFCYLQRAVGIRRFKDREVHAAWEWASITQELAEYLVCRKQKILKDWKFTYCCDELFIPTEITGTKFEGTLSSLGSLRFIEWEWQARRDHAPKALTLDDKEKLDDPKVLFARKFVSPQSDQLINELIREVK